jgi:hypothetical protein
MSMAMRREALGNAGSRSWSRLLCSARSGCMGAVEEQKRPQGMRGLATERRPACESFVQACFNRNTSFHPLSMSWAALDNRSIEFWTS